MAAYCRRMAQGGVDLLILDVMLPGKDGFEVLAELRARGDATPVLILSARADDQDRIRGLELQADDYLTKPFNLRELLLRVDALVPRQHLLLDALEVEVRGRRRRRHAAASPLAAVFTCGRARCCERGGERTRDERK